ncbi:MAG TPA: hypothetical protein VEF35_02285 [Candidatus Bathyarchaeia archaeon]|nr:hypothetical protein [Candidatus Bathyarchaeia archaeon]
MDNEGLAAGLPFDGTTPATTLSAAKSRLVRLWVTHAHKIKKEITPERQRAGGTFFGEPWGRE